MARCPPADSPVAEEQRWSDLDLVVAGQTVLHDGEHPSLLILPVISGA